VLVEEELAGLSPKKDMLLTIGVFDGVHLGHKYLLSQLMERARRQDLLSGVVTFRRHPQEVLSSRTRLPFLTDITERANLLKNEGIDAIIILSFTRELAQLSASQFVGLLKKYLRMRGLVVGPDFTLGRNRDGNIDNLRTLGQDMNFTVTVIPPIMINGEVVSSTTIRNALANGDMKKVLNLAGRPFSLSGHVTSGAGRGLELGFPTANLDIVPQQALPADGVYATWAHINGKTYQSMTNVGKQPTFGSNRRTVEVYILDYQSDLYGHELKIDIMAKVRSEQCFSSVDDLKKQITEDIKQGRAILDSRDGN